MGLKDVVLFAGSDNTSFFGRSNLWISDGTAAGTRQIVPPTAPDNGVQPADIAVLGNKAVFEGINKIGVRFLWVTDGTSSGTMDLGVASGPRAMTTFGNKVLFQAFFQAPGTTPSDSLWITDGTKAGTSEIPVSGASEFGLSPARFTPFGSKALFVGQDSHLVNALWVTDGTSAGTSELSPANTYPQGLFAISSVTTPSFAALGNQVFFQGWDVQQHSALWVTDGTSIGTTEVHLPGEALPGIDPEGIANIGNKVIFAGLDPTALDQAGQRDLWLTDGTPAGTSVIPLPGLFFFGPPDFTLFGNKVLFAASPGPGDYNLWELDLTTSAVSKLTVANAGPSGLFWNGGQFSPEFTVLGNEVLFRAVDANNHVGLWVTDGTSGGTFELVVPGANPHGLSPGDLNFFVLSTPPVLSSVPANVAFAQGTTVTLAPSAMVSDPASATLTKATVAITAGTFANDGDMLAASTTGTSISASYNSATETLTLSGVDTLTHYEAVLDSITFSSGADFGHFGANPSRTVSWTLDDGGASNNLSAVVTTTIAVPEPLLHIIGSGDFDADHDTNGDFVLQAPDGSVFSIDLNGAQVTELDLLGQVPANWRAVATGDFNNDGNSDIVLQSDAGHVLVWQMNGAQIAAQQIVGQLPPNWHFSGAGDFNGDGKSDLLWASETGGVIMWQMDGLHVASNQFLGQIPANWHVVAIGDFNGDHQSDILLQSDAGGIVLWEMNGTQVAVNQFIGQIPSNWHVAATGDFNGDGKSDVLFHSDTGGVVEWQINGMQVAVNQFIGQVPTNWHISKTGDFNGDGKSDVLWISDDSDIQLWEMNGTQVLLDQTLDPSSPPASPPLNAHASAVDTAAAVAADASLALPGTLGGIDPHALSQAALAHDPHFLV